MSNVTPYTVWKELCEHGPLHVDELVDRFDSTEDEIAKTIRWLSGKGHSLVYVYATPDRRWEANELNNISIQSGPFGAGAGDTTTAEKPPNYTVID